MTVKFLISPFTSQPAAEVLTGKKVKIFEENLARRLINGISVPNDFRKQYHIKKIGPIFPSDGEEVFAKAFELFEFVHGLQQAGYHWVDEKDAHLYAPYDSSEKIAKRAIELYEEWQIKKNK